MAADDDRKVRGVAFRDLFERVERAKQYEDSEGNFRQVDRSELVRQCIRVGLPLIQGMREHPDWADPGDIPGRELNTIGTQLWVELRDSDE